MSGGNLSGGAGGEPIWDEDLSHLLNSPDQGSLPWQLTSTNSTGMSGPTRKDIGRLSSFDLAELNHHDMMSSTQDVSYERKKSRAKITRVEVNNGFDDLLQVLRLPNSRKNSRAKVIQYACERIRALEQENERLKQQVPLPGTLPPSAAAGAMVWIPCTSMLLPQLPQHQRVPQRSKRVKKTTALSSSTKSTSTTAPSILQTLVTTCPHVLRHFDASTLARLMQVSSEWNIFLGDVKQAYLWEALVGARWRIAGAALAAVAPGQTMRQKWLHLHKSMALPRLVYAQSAASCPSDEDAAVVAKGRAGGIAVWAILARRSNSRTTRSVWRDGAVAVMQVVEVHIVVQNTNGGTAVGVTSAAVAPFTVLDASYGNLFAPRWIARNGVKVEGVGMPDLMLQHLDVGVLSVYVSCPHVEFEDDFLTRAHSIRVICCGQAKTSQRVVVVDAPMTTPSMARQPSHATHRTQLK
ncbi:hypothetical protein H257_09214 [Aphanomyces astaci]|uniref:F-box domain-containing protein n=1 Tax=Aphanomyces astaci TaxID=112090 RepID=W4GCF8_APHAT|nr:hypothetical protein, variant [Aphanomyces astaci]XP_009833666.1 hypothetical protein H257_09214 [Aphanomyces astaci]ETV76753.1 hypothetical protein H257_09214 [Aphanomyces astaci]ETV76754.1 hypothetical protein, variant [Aphanomyces astaci]|eukprot:XP_009833665.1 hypothetical protein, variant [Aphanomyces astaci]